MADVQAQTLDYEAPDLWYRAARLRWGRYLATFEARAVEVGMRQFAHPARALDVGAEKGRWTRKLLQHGWCVTSTEICEKKWRNVSE